MTVTIVIGRPEGPQKCMHGEEEYCLQCHGLSRWLLRCPHGSVGFCFVCNPRRISEHNKKVRWILEFPRTGILNTALVPGDVLKRFPRWKGFFRVIDFGRTLEKWSSTWWPPDHEIARIERRFRPVDREAGGYRPTRGDGYTRGLGSGPDQTTYGAIGSVPDFEETEDPTGVPLARMPSPSWTAAEGYFWTEEDFAFAPLYKTRFVTIRLPLPATPPILFVEPLGTRPTTEEPHRDGKRYWESHLGKPKWGNWPGTVPYHRPQWVSPLAPETCTDDDIRKWRHKYWRRKRAKYDPIAGNRYPPTASKRDLQDQSARMEMYAWGSHDEVIDRKQMAACAIKRVKRNWEPLVRPPLLHTQHGSSEERPGGLTHRGERIRLSVGAGHAGDPRR